jgi:hypothetical protein
MFRCNESILRLTVAILLPLSLFSCDVESSSHASVPVAAGDPPLEMESAWLPSKTPATEWLPRGSRVTIAHTVLLRDETLTSATEWVLMDAKKQKARTPRGYFVKYLTEAGMQDVCPSEPSETKRCVVFVGAGNIAFLAEVATGATCRVELKSKPPSATREQKEREIVGDLGMAAAMLPGADFTTAWEPRRPALDTGRGGPGQETFSRGALLTAKLRGGSKAWSIVDAKQQPVSIEHGHFVKLLTASGIEDAPSTTSDQAKGSVVFVGAANVAIFIEVEKGAVCRVDVNPE